MILFYILYRKSDGTESKRYVVASTEDNAWVALQAADSTAISIESIGEVATNLIIGS